MQLGGRDLVARTIVVDARNEQVRPASYELSLGSVWVGGKEALEEQVDIEPHQTVVLVSAETVQMPAGYVGNVSPKTSLCWEGLLVLNTGLVDPGYRGPISTVAINFGKESLTLRKGTTFLRLTAARLVDRKAQDVISYDRKTYLAKIKGDSKAFPRTFLDIPGQIGKISHQVLQRQFNYFIGYLAIFTIGLALIAYFLPPRSSDVLTGDALRRVMQAERTNAELREMEARLQVLEQRLREATVTRTQASEASSAPGSE